MIIKIIHRKLLIFIVFSKNHIIIKYLPDFLQATHCATFPVALSSIPDVEESASQTGDVDVISHPSATPEISPQTLQPPVERHLYEVWPLGHFPISEPSPAEPSIILSLKWI